MYVLAIISFANDLDAYERQLRSYFVLFFASSSIRHFLIEADNYDCTTGGCKIANKKKRDNGSIFQGNSTNCRPMFNGGLLPK